MDIIKIAKERERSLFLLYTDLARDSTYNRAKHVFELMLEEEKEHIGYIDSLETLVKKEIKEDIKVEPILMLHELRQREEIKNLKGCDCQLEIYKKVRGYEHESQIFYERLLDKAQSKELKEAIGLLIEEEKRHCDLLDSIIDFISTPKIRCPPKPKSLN